MEFEKNTILFGADPTMRIVAVELGETGTVKVHRREKDGSTITEVEPFHPFVWADSDVVDLGIEAEKLRGDLKYGWLITVDSWKELIALRNGLKSAGRDFFAFTDSTCQGTMLAVVSLLRKGGQLIENLARFCHATGLGISVRKHGKVRRRRLQLIRLTIFRDRFLELAFSFISLTKNLMTWEQVRIEFECLTRLLDRVVITSNPTQARSIGCINYER